MQDHLSAAATTALQSRIDQEGPAWTAESSHAKYSIGAGMCFDELLLLGRANSHVTFFGSKEIALSFKSYILSSLGIPVKEQSAGYPPPLIPARDRLLKVTFILRSGPNRLINNFPQVRALLDGSPYVDKMWLTRHILFIETLTFKQQVQLMYDSDVVITIHGAAIVNGFFMRTGSVLIDTYNGRYLEFVFDPMLRESGIKLQHLILSDHYHSNVTNCSPFPDKCLQGEVMFGTDFACLGIRQCSFDVSLTGLHSSLMEAYHHVLSVKWIPLEEGRVDAMS
jgi:hypothetical protein